MMNKFQKMMSGTLAGCLMASALMMSAGAANVQTYIPSGTVQAAAQKTAQTRTAVKINPQSADIYAEGIPATFPSEDGKTVYTALSYNGSTYMPLRTVGRWMGKNISWDGASRTVFLSGTTEKSYPCADDDAYHKEGVKYVGATGHATLDKGVKVLVDGKQQIFKNQKGVTIYPLFYQNSIYLPLRNIGELTGMDVTWYSAKAENDVNAIFLRMPLSDSKRAEMETYATNLMKQLLDMRTDTQKIKNCASAVKNGGYTDYVVTDKATAMAALDSIKRKAQTIRSGMTEQENPIRYYNSSLMNELDFLINNADTVMDRVKNGRVVVGSSNPDTSVVDQTAVMFGADNTMLDCERMVRMLRQNMDRLF